jgi:hypothetical membrane protein
MNNTEIISTDIKASLTKSGLLLFLSGFMIFMGIITGEIFYTLDFNTRDNYISELAAAVPPNAITPEPSATIFNLTMIVTGIMIMFAAFYLQIIFKKLLTTIPAALFGFGVLGVGIFPGNIHPWHGIFALILFVAGGVGAITSYKIVSSPLRYIFIILGITALVFLIAYKYFVPALGVGGTERWVLYPVIFWITGLGGYLLGIKDEYKRISHV